MSMLYKSLAAGLMTAAIISLLCAPLLGRSKHGESARSHAMFNTIHTERAKIQSEIAAGHLSQAEEDAKTLIAKGPTLPLNELELADVYSAEHRYSEAWPIYRKAILPNLTNFGDSDRLFRFGDDALAGGHSEDAIIAFRRVVNSEHSYVDHELLDPVFAEDAKPSEVRFVAKLLVANVSQPPGYIAMVQNAVRLHPSEPVSHYLYAETLAKFGHFRDANEQLNAAAALLPPDRGSAFRTRAYYRFGLDRIDHGSRGVIDQHGRLTVTYFPLPLPNSSSPLVDRAAPPQVRPRTP